MSSVYLVLGGAASAATCVGVYIGYLAERRRSRSEREELRQEQGDIKAVVLGEEARQGVPARPGVNARFDGIEQKLDTLVAKVAGAAILNGKGDVLLATVAETRELVTTHRAVSNQNMANLRDDVRVIGERQVELITGMRVDREQWRESLEAEGVTVPPVDHLPDIT